MNGGNSLMPVLMPAYNATKYIEEVIKCPVNR